MSLPRHWLHPGQHPPQLLDLAAVLIRNVLHRLVEVEQTAVDVIEVEQEFSQHHNQP